jgi:EAL domain-containing protein (putative c-di-GMP-specific phosphodiesterase class I)
MYAAKDSGKGRVAIFEPAMRAQLVERMELGSELGLAVERDELVLEYQPLVELESGRIAGVEALIRWHHPTRGRLAPDRFIELAESNGHIVGIGRWVVQTACAQLRRWDDRHPGAARLEMSVNVSTRQLADPGLPARRARRPRRERHRGVPAHAGDHRAPAARGRELMQQRLQALKDIGVHLAVDDFGTGYSALSYLQTSPSTS